MAEIKTYMVQLWVNYISLITIHETVLCELQRNLFSSIDHDTLITDVHIHIPQLQSHTGHPLARENGHIEGVIAILHHLYGNANVISEKSLAGHVSIKMNEEVSEVPDAVTFRWITATQE